MMNKLSPISATIAAMAGAHNNSVPIYGTYPGYSQGANKLDISIEMFLGPLCGDSADQNDVLNSLMVTEWQGAKVRDQITLKITPFTLPYQVHSYPVTELFPYFMDLCISDSSKCMTALYKDYAYEHFSTILSMTDYSEDSFIVWWTGKVAAEFNLDQASLQAAYDGDRPDKGGDWPTRTFFKYGASHGVSATPTTFVNGVALDSVPSNIDAWIEVLDSVYDSQYKVKHRFDHLKE
jgi:hypothetical protein